MAVGKPTRHLSLLMPGALGPVDLMDPAQLPPLPAFSRLIARADQAAFFPLSTEAALCRLFALDVDEEQLPVAPITYALETGQSRVDWCMRADPVFLVPGQNSLMLMADGRELQLGAEESRDLIAELNRHFTESGLRFEAPNAEHWYVFADRQRVRTTPLSQVRGRSLTGRLPEGEDGVYWNAVLAELQMLLHGLNVNFHRASVNLPQVNSLWFWGAGRMPDVPVGQWTRVWSHDALLMGLADASGVARADLPADGSEWLARAEAGSHLLVVDALSSQLPDIPQAAWSTVMQALEPMWWQPLFQALRSGRLDSLSLYPLNGQVYRLDRGAARRWWRRSLPWSRRLEISDYAQAN